MSLLPFNFIGEGSEATPGLWNSPLSVLSANIAGVAANQGSGLTMSVLSDVSIGGGVYTAAPSNLSGAVTIHANSNVTDYLSFTDSSNARSNYLLGSHAGGTADGLNIYDASGATMIVSFSKQSVRFYQSVVGPVFDVGGALASTYNAATFGGSTKTGQIQAAILQAATDSVARVYLPASFYPYNASQISFVYTVQMVREGGAWDVYDVVAYGAKGDDIQDDAPGFLAAVSGASFGGGGVVYMPGGAIGGAYRITSPVTLPPTDTNSIYLLGQGTRDVTIRPAASCHTAIMIGDTTHQTLYGRLADFTVKGSDVASGHTGCGIHMIQAKYWDIDRVNVESFLSGTGVYLQGQAYSTGSELARNSFYKLFVSTCQRPGYMQNCDENEFYSCIFGLPINSTSSVTALEINQGRNNRFYGLLLAGDSTNIATARKNYIGLYGSDPVIGGGSNGYNQIYGLVAEGFEKGIVLQSTTEQGYFINEYHSSINSVDIVDNGQDTIYVAPQQAIAKYSGAFPYSPAVTISAGSQLPTVQKGHVFATANTSLTTIVGFANAVSGSMFWVEVGSSDQSTVFQDSAGSLRLWGRSSITGSPEMIIPFVQIGGTVYQAGIPLLARTVGISGSTGVFESPLPLSAKNPGSATTPAFTFSSELSLGFYRSAASQIQQTYGIFVADLMRTGGGSATTPGLAFQSGKSIGLFDAGSQILGIVGGGTAVAYVYANQFNWSTDGTALQPINGYFSERSLGLYRSHASTVALSFGTLDMSTSGAVASLASITVKSGANNSCGTAVLGSNGSVNVANTYVKTGDIVMLTDQTAGGTLGTISLGGIRNASGFTIVSNNVADTSTVAWLIIHPS